MRAEQVTARREPEELSRYLGLEAAEVRLPAVNEFTEARDGVRGRDGQLFGAGANGHLIEIKNGTLLGQPHAELNALLEQLAAARCAREQLEQRVRQLEAALGARIRSKPTVSPAIARSIAAPLAAPMPGWPVPPKLTVLHVEGRTPFREAVRNAVERFGHVRYQSRDTVRTVNGRVLVAVNLLASNGDPLASAARAAEYSGEELRAFAYCADGDSVLVVGVVDVFPRPFNPDTCALRILTRRRNVRCVLAVSEDVESMGVVREILGRANCSTPVVFDTRQALDLLPVVNPDFLLIDLALPSGEALLLISRLKSNPESASLPLGLFCSKPLARAEFRSYVQRIMHARPLPATELTRAMAHALAETETMHATGEPAQPVFRPASAQP